MAAIHSNDIVINDPTVSAHHASLTKTPAGYRLRDLASTNGTERNNIRVADAELKDRDEIRFGSVAAVFRAADAKSDQSDGPMGSVGSVGITPAVPNLPSLSRISRRRVFAALAVLAIIAISIGGWFAVAHYQRRAGAPVDLVSLAKATQDAVVLIQVFDNAENAIATGSGFFVSPDWLLVTNCHVIEEATSAVAKSKRGNVFAIKGALRIDRKNDLILLAVEGKNLPFLTLGRSELLQTGDNIAVIGSPLGLEGSLSAGIVSPKRQETERAREWLQISAPISPGSSGSPVLDTSGKVIGVATMGLRGGQSLNFAVPAELVAAMLSTHAGRHQKPSAPIPLQVIARANAFEAAAAELAVLQSPQYTEAESALSNAFLAAEHNSVRQKLEQDLAVGSASSATYANAAAALKSLGGYKQADWGKALNAAKARQLIRRLQNTSL